MFLFLSIVFTYESMQIEQNFVFYILLFFMDTLLNNTILRNYGGLNNNNLLSIIQEDQ